MWSDCVGFEFNWPPFFDLFEQDLVYRKSQKPVLTLGKSEMTSLALSTGRSNCTAGNGLVS
jgi:hypothetical protein